MRSPVRGYKSFWIGCLMLAMISGTSYAENSCEITGVSFEPQSKEITIAHTGSPGKHSVRVIGNPNRLIMDVEQMGLGKAPRRIPVAKSNIHEIRVGTHKTGARLVVDFQNHPVPAFNVQREDGKLAIVFGNSLARELPSGKDAAPAADSKKHSSHLTPDFIPAAAKASGSDVKPVAQNFPKASYSEAVNNIPKQSVGQNIDTKNTKIESDRESKNHQNAQSYNSARGVHLAQANNSPIGPIPRRSDVSPGPTPPSAPDSASPPQGGAQMVREVRPPVTPPTPDPRLVVQEITELKFTQVGHNSRLIVRGGDHLDYRLNKVSPTKIRLDLINAEIPKAHQKPLRTDLFSTSVEMIVPGSQTIFIQLKDAVPYQVEKQKGVLMVDFPPPRFTVPPDQKTQIRAGDTATRELYEKTRETRREAFRAMRELEARRDNEMRRRTIESLQKQMDELQKQRTEIIKKYQVTPDPEVFSKPVTMDFQGISLRNAFRLLAEQAGINIIVGDEVTGTATLRLFQVPLGQVIETLLNTHGLDREMIGNVMRVGKKAEIQAFKKQREEEYKKRLSEVDQSIDKVRQDIQKTQEQIEATTKELEKKEVIAPEAAEDTKTEEIGEAGCMKIGTETVCFYFATVRLVYQNPDNIVNTLDCMFNMRCEKARGRTDIAPGGAGSRGTASETASTAPGGVGVGLYEAQMRKRTEEESSRLKQEGFQEGSPGYEARMRRAVRDEQDKARTQAVVAQTFQAAPPSRVTWGLTPDLKLQQIIANSMLWADPPNRMILIKDTADRIAQMKKMIYTLDVPTPQVLIESRLVQATRDWSRGLGILWGGRNNYNYPLSNNRTVYWGFTGNQAGAAANTATGQTTAGNDIPSRFAVNLPATVSGLSNLMGLGVQFGFLANQYITELDARIQLGEATGQAKTIARPKVQVLDGQTANIKNGRTIAYSTVSADGTQTQLVNVDLLLDVTPTIFSDGRIRMRVKVTDNDLGGIVNNQQEILNREAQTVMIVKDGETAVIGGIVRRTDNNRREGWPGLMNVPIINALFSNKTRSIAVQELLVFITPTIVKRPPAAS